MTDSAGQPLVTIPANGPLFDPQKFRQSISDSVGAVVPDGHKFAVIGVFTKTADNPAVFHTAFAAKINDNWQVEAGLDKDLANSQPLSGHAQVLLSW